MIDAEGCRAEALRDGKLLGAICTAIIDELDLHVVGTPQWHQFRGPGGWTGMYLLTESHLTIHTFPEYGVATLNLYCCRERDRWDWEAQLSERLGAEHVRVRRLARGDERGLAAGHERVARGGYP
jgi:S-adenosylmethionine decarboxylase